MSVQHKKHKEMAPLNIQKNIETSNPPTTVRLSDRRTTVRLFGIELEALQKICAEKNVSLDDFCTIAARDPSRPEHSLTAKVRGAMVKYLLDQWQAPPV